MPFLDHLIFNDIKRVVDVAKTTDIVGRPVAVNGPFPDGRKCCRAPFILRLFSTKILTSGVKLYR